MEEIRITGYTDTTGVLETAVLEGAFSCLYIERPVLW
jgi:hypothetical protein